MIIWKGIGILGVLVPFILGALLQWIFKESYLFPGLGYIIGGIPFWFLGRRLNANSSPDPDLDSFGKWITAEHHAFFIPIQYWALIFMAIGIFTFFPDGSAFYFDKTLQFFGFYLGTVMLYCIYLRIRKPEAYKRHIKPFFEKESDKKAPLAKTEKLKTTKSNRPGKAKNDFRKTTIIKEKLKDFEASDHTRFIPKPKSKGDQIKE